MIVMNKCCYVSFTDLEIYFKSVCVHVHAHLFNIVEHQLIRLALDLLKIISVYAVIYAVYNS